MFSAWYPTPNDTLLGNFVQNHAQAIALQAQVIVIHPYEQGHAYHLLHHSENNLHEILISFPRSGKGPIAKCIRFYRMLRAYAIGIQHAIHQYGLPDICHVNVLTRSCLPAFYLKRKYHIPYIITEHWSRYLPGEPGFTHPLHKYITRLMVKHAQAVTTVSSHLAQAMQLHGLRQTYITIPNVINEDIFTLATPDHNSHTILHVSNLDSGTKNWEEILQATALLAASRQDFTLLLLGDGPDKPMVQAKATALGLTPHIVQFHADIPNTLMPDYIHQCCCQLLYSTTETQGLVLIESLCCGKPVIASDINAIRETIGTDNGILVPLHQPELLAQAMNTMLNHEYAYSPEKLRHYAISRYGKSVIGNAFIQLYLQILHMPTSS